MRGLGERLGLGLEVKGGGGSYIERRYACGVWVSSAARTDDAPADAKRVDDAGEPLRDDSEVD